MTTKEVKRKKWASAGLLLLLGLGAVFQSLSYNVGSAARMGPGYFPLMLGILLLLLGLVVFVLPDAVEEELDEVEKEEPKPWQDSARPWIAIVASMLLFILVGKYGGLVPATFVMIVCAALGDKANSPKSALFLGIGVTVAAVGLFHYGLQMQFPLFTWG